MSGTINTSVTNTPATNTVISETLEMIVWALTVGGILLLVHGAARFVALAGYVNLPITWASFSVLTGALFALSIAKLSRPQDVKFRDFPSMVMLASLAIMTSMLAYVITYRLMPILLGIAA